MEKSRLSGFDIYLIGRSADVDIQVDDSSVSRLHAELIIASSGGYYLTDCVSSGGTFQEKNGEWVRIRQEFVGLTDTLLLGRYQTTPKQLLAMAAQSAGGKAGSATGNAGRPALKRGGSADDDRPHGPVRRNEETGDIIPTGED